MIPDDTIEQVRDAADIIGLIGESVELKRTGADWRGPCPFHGGTHRNFAVIPKKGLFYCYVCHEKGDVFSFLMKRLGMDYPAAVREVARRVGIVIPDRPARSGPDPHEPLYAAAAAAQDWFARQLVDAREAAVAREYLASRDVTMEAAAPIGLGYAPPGRAFISAMAELGVGEPVLLEAGLVARRDDGSVVPRFRSRLLFPIHDLRGRPVGFGGRMLGPGEPKYLNSPETPIFSKGRMLYNLHSAKNAIRKEEHALVVEGYFDVLRLSLAGIEHVVAPLGTALTSEQAVLLRRYTPTVTLLYDSDAAGQRATFRAGDELLRHGARVRVATMPTGQDPDTLVRTGGAEALGRIVDEAIDVMERKIQLLERGGWFTTVEQRREALDKLLPTVRAASDPITRQLYLSLVAERTGVSRDVLEHEASSRPADLPVPRVPSTPARQRPPEGARRRFGARAERQLLLAMLAAPEWCERAAAEVDPALIEGDAMRELFRSLAGGSATTGQLPDALSREAQLAWSELKEAISVLSTTDVSKIYDGAAQQIQALPEFRAIEQLTDPGEKQHRLAALFQRFPEARAQYGYYRAAHRRTP